jgi:hypothetical protein
MDASYCRFHSRDVQQRKLSADIPTTGISGAAIAIGGIARLSQNPRCGRINQSIEFEHLEMQISAAAQHHARCWPRMG